MATLINGAISGDAQAISVAINEQEETFLLLKKTALRSGGGALEFHSPIGNRLSAAAAHQLATATASSQCQFSMSFSWTVATVS